MQTPLLRALAGLMAAAAFAAPVSAADPAPDSTAPWYSRWADTAVTETSDIIRNGGWDFYFPTKIYHLPIAYTAEQRNRYNESPMPAFGMGRGKFLENGNWHGLYAMGFRDSNDKPSWMAGYQYRWLWDAPSIGAHYGVGVSVFLMSREDYFNYVPFPAALPTFTLGWRNVSLETAFVPGAKGNGNVFFIWFKLEEKERPRS